MNTLMTACLSALVALPVVANAQTATTEAPAQTETMAAPSTTAAPAAPAAPAAGAAEATKPDMVEYVTSEATGFLYASDLIGQPVYGITDEKTGDINDLLLDEEGRVEAVVIGVGGFIGIGEKDVAVTLGSLDIKPVDNDVRITIAATEEALEAAPTYTRADGTTSDRLGAFERSYNRTAAEAGKALDEASRRANELYEKGRKAVTDLTEGDEATETAPTAN